MQNFGVCAMDSSQNILTFSWIPHQYWRIKGKYHFLGIPYSPGNIPSMYQVKILYMTPSTANISNTWPNTKSSSTVTPLKMLDHWTPWPCPSKRLNNWKIIVFRGKTVQGKISAICPLKPTHRDVRFCFVLFLYFKVEKRVYSPNQVGPICHTEVEVERGKQKSVPVHLHQVFEYNEVGRVHEEPYDACSCRWQTRTVEHSWYKEAEGDAWGGEKEDDFKKKTWLRFFTFFWRKTNMAYNSYLSF